jgi:hypothetical protein
VWRADHSEHGTLFLLGSVHLNKERIGNLGPAVGAAWQGSEELVVEIDTSALSSGEISALMERYGILTPPLTLADVLPAELWQRIVVYVRSRGISEKSIMNWKPWFLYLVLIQLEFARAGYESENGVDELFVRAAEGTMPIVALESMDSQLEIFDQLPALLQQQLLEDALTQADDVPNEVAALVDAWMRGDADRLTELVFQPLDEKPELAIFYDRVFFQRNRSMTAGLEEIARDRKTRLVVVGAGHMLGAEGIPTLLEERGWSVVVLGGLVH